uniref:Cytochrome P450 n=1 Tax=Populus trichocarpa TaxID=3694 RepID=A0A2K2C4U2_POPTR
MNAPAESRQGDFIDQVIVDMDKESFESISAALTNTSPEVNRRSSFSVRGVDTILNTRENLDSPLTWIEYNSMTFNFRLSMKHFGSETSRPGLFSNPTTFKDPLEFNPWRSKEFDSFVVSKNLMPFVGGRRKCAGTELTILLMASIFLQKLVTKYK